MCFEDTNYSEVMFFEWIKITVNSQSFNGLNDHPEIDDLYVEICVKNLYFCYRFQTSFLHDWVWSDGDENTFRETIFYRPTWTARQRKCMHHGVLHLLCHMLHGNVGIALIATYHHSFLPPMHYMVVVASPQSPPSIVASCPRCIYGSGSITLIIIATVVILFVTLVSHQTIMMSLASTSLDIWVAVTSLSLPLPPLTFDLCSWHLLTRQQQHRKRSKRRQSLSFLWVSKSLRQVKALHVFLFLSPFFFLLFLYYSHNQLLWWRIKYQLDLIRYFYHSVFCIS